ncbi:MAG: tRNA (adenosine(37)-N6)-threonylcarbamoyltransferase complex dimerization subunit type 1 TsaB [Porticoccaceae bacterium]
MAAILTIDTATDACSAAIGVDDKVYFRQEITARDHSRLILPMIDALLREAGLTLSRLDALAFTCGPGSFTGLRIGMGVVQGLAFGANLPVISISTLQVLAAGAIRSANAGEGAVVIPALDARMDEVYWGQYRNHSGFPEAIAPDRLDKPEDVRWPSWTGDASAAGVTALTALGVGDGWRFGDRMACTPTYIIENLVPLATDLLLVATIHYGRGLLVSADDLEPVYLRDTINWKKRQRLRLND